MSSSVPIHGSNFLETMREKMKLPVVIDPKSASSASLFPKFLEQTLADMKYNNVFRASMPKQGVIYQTTIVQQPMYNMIVMVAPFTMINGDKNVPVVCSVSSEAHARQLLDDGWTRSACWNYVAGSIIPAGFSNGSLFDAGVSSAVVSEMQAQYQHPAVIVCTPAAVAATPGSGSPSTADTPWTNWSMYSKGKTYADILTWWSTGTELWKPARDWTPAERLKAGIHSSLRSNIKRACENIVLAFANHDTLIYEAAIYSESAIRKFDKDTYRCRAPVVAGGGGISVAVESVVEM